MSAAHSSRLSPGLLRGASIGALLVGGLTAGIFACETTESYVYSAQKYDPTADCLAPYAPVEIVNGEGASANCPNVCLALGDDLYVSSMCTPLPIGATPVAADAGPCIAALAAAARDAGTCEDLGASTGEEGGPIDEEGGVEAGEPDADAGDGDASDGSKPIVDAAEAG